MKKSIYFITILSTIFLATPSSALEELEEQINSSDVPLEVKGLKFQGLVQAALSSSVASDDKNISVSPGVAINLTLNGRYNIFKDTKFIFKLTGKSGRIDGLGFHQSYIGLEGKFGSVYIGKVFSETIYDLDKLQVDDFYQLGTIYRLNNAITYKSPDFHGLKGRIQTTVNSSDMNALDLGIRYEGVKNLFIGAGFLQARNEKYRNENFYYPVHAFGQENSLSKKTSAGVVDENYKVTTKLVYLISKYTIDFNDKDSMYFIFGYKHNNFLTNNTQPGEFKDLAFNQTGLRVGYVFNSKYEISLAYLYTSEGKGKKVDNSIGTVTPIRQVSLNFEADLGKKATWGIGTSYQFWNKETMAKSPLGEVGGQKTNEKSSSFGVSTTVTIIF